MDKTSRQRIGVILFLSVVTVLLFAGILVNVSISNHLFATTIKTSAPTFLPSLFNERCYGTKENDTFIGAYFVRKETYVFYNAECGIMQREGEKENLQIKLEGQLLFVTLTPQGFAVALKKEDNLSIKIIDFDGIPTSSIPITLKNAEIQYLGYDENVCVAIKHQGDFDYVLSYFKYDIHLTQVYHRDVYSLYNLSLVACYPMSNKTIMFFNATYGSVKRGGYTILHNESLSMQTEYFSGVENYEVLDAKPYKNGFILTLLTPPSTRVIIMDENMAQSTPEDLGDYERAKIHTDSNSCYLELVKGDEIDLVNYETKETVVGFANEIYDCIFIDGSAVFATRSGDTVYARHLITGITAPIICGHAQSVKLIKNGRLSVFATLNASSAISPIGGMDVYFASLC